MRKGVVMLLVGAFIFGAVSPALAQGPIARSAEAAMQRVRGEAPEAWERRSVPMMWLGVAAMTEGAGLALYGFVAREPGCESGSRTSGMRCTPDYADTLITVGVISYFAGLVLLGVGKERVQARGNSVSIRF